MTGTSLKDYLEGQIKDSEDWSIYHAPYFNGLRPSAVLMNHRSGSVWMIQEVLFTEEELFAMPSREAKTLLSYPFKARRMIMEELFPLLCEYDQRYSVQLFQVRLYFKHLDRSQLRRFALKHHAGSTGYLIGCDERERLNFTGERKDFSKVHEFYNTLKIESAPSLGEEICHWVGDAPVGNVNSRQRRFNELVMQQKNRYLAAAYSQETQYKCCIKGASGSGKTSQLAMMAAMDALQGKKVLVLTYNVTLPMLIAQRIRQYVGEENGAVMGAIKISNYHWFCRSEFMRVNLEWPFSFNRKPLQAEVDRFFGRDDEGACTRQIVSALSRSTDSYAMHGQDWFDLILLDEIQDYKYQWTVHLQRYLKDNGRFMVFMDERQNLYNLGKPQHDVQEVRRIQAELKHTVNLKANYRYRQNHADALNEFSERFLSEAENVYQVNKSDNTQLSWERTNLFWHEFSQWEYSSGDYKGYLLDVYEFLRHAGINREDMAFLFEKKKTGRSCLGTFKQAGVDVIHAFDSTSKRCFSPVDSRLKLMTINSFKGYDSKAVVVLLEPEMKWNDWKNHLLYVALSRGKDYVIVLNANRTFTEYGKSWEVFPVSFPSEKAIG